MQHVKEKKTDAELKILKKHLSKRRWKTKLNRPARRVRNKFLVCFGCGASIGLLCSSAIFLINGITPKYQKKYIPYEFYHTYRDDYGRNILDGFDPSADLDLLVNYNTMFIYDTIDAIDNYSFDKSRNDPLHYIPDDIKYLDFSYATIKGYIIGDGSFNECNNFDEVTFARVISIGNSAFNNCSSIKKTVYFDNTLTNIGAYAFNNCFSMVGDLRLNNTINNIGHHAFANCKKINGTLLIPSSIIEINDSVFENCFNIQQVSFQGPSNIESFLANSFSNCYSLQSVDFSSLTMLETIGDSAFANCSNLRSVNFNGLKKITLLDRKSFYNCEKLSIVNLYNNDNLSTIGDSAFANCNNLTSFDFLNTNISYIKDSAFANCSNLFRNNYSSFFNDMIVEFGSNSFENVFFLISLTFYGMIPPIRGANCFGWNDINSHVIKVNANNVDAYIQAWPDYASIIQAL